MRLHELKPASGSRRPARRVGRGIGSGDGKTAGRGQKGQGARSGGSKGPAFEGGQTPLQRRLPKRGFNNARFRQAFAVVNLRDLDRFDKGEPVTPERMHEAGLVGSVRVRVKVLGEGDAPEGLVVRAHAFSRSAREKLEAAGGKTEVI